MILSNNILRKMKYKLSYHLYETGGILGSKNNIINYFIFDKGVCSENKGVYVPNTNILNNNIEYWNINNIKFSGIIHTHFQKVYGLSEADIRYIKRIMSNMPISIDSLYFPLFYPLENKIMSFKAIRNNSEVVILKDNIKVI